MDNQSRINEISARLKETKTQLGYIDGMTGPIVLGVFGALTIPFLGFGLLLIIGAVIWAYTRQNSQTQLKTLILQYESELSRLQGA